MIVGIDASNLRAGGGLTHLRELLSAAEPEKLGIRKVIVWCGTPAAGMLPDRNWLEVIALKTLDAPLPIRLLWQRFMLGRALKAAGCTVLFVPGGSVLSRFRPVVTMSRNLLPFEPHALKAEGMTVLRMKLWLLRRAQIASIRKADATIFLTQYARRVLQRESGLDLSKSVVIPHGIASQFFAESRKDRRTLGEKKGPLRLLYVSSLFKYKNHEVVVKAIAGLLSRRIQVQLDLVGNGDKVDVQRVLRLIDAEGVGAAVRLHQGVKYSEVSRFYREADICLFASTCENMPNILLECMASGAPVISTNCGPMPEIMGEAGIYFNANDPSELQERVLELAQSRDLQVRLANEAKQRAREYSWNACARRTLELLRSIDTRDWNREKVG